MALKQSGNGQFQIPADPSVGTVVAQSASANTYGLYVAMTASTTEADFLTGICYAATLGANLPTYLSVTIGTGPLNSETTVGVVHCPIVYTAGVAGSVTSGYVPINPPIPIPAGTRVVCKTASSLASAVSWVLSLTCCKQADLVDAGINESADAKAINAVSTSSVIAVLAYVGTSEPLQFTASTLVKCDAIDWNGVGVTGMPMPTYTQPTGFLAATFPGTVASPTNITSASGVSLAANQHVVVDSGTVTTLANLPAIPVGWLTAAGIAAGALNGKGDWNVGKTGYSLTQAFPANFAALGISVGGHVSNVDTLTTYSGNTVQTGDAYARVGAAGVGLTNLGDARIAHLDADVSSRMATYTQPTGFLAEDFAELDADIEAIQMGVAAIPTNPYTGTPPTTAQIATALWQDLLAGTDFATAGSVGALLKADVDAAISSRSTYAGGDTAGTTTLLSRLTQAVLFDANGFVKADVEDWKAAAAPANTGDAYARVGAGGAGLTNLGDTRLAHLDADVSSRLATAGYVAPDNADIAAIKAKTDNLPANPAAAGSAMTVDFTQAVPNAPAQGTVGAALLGMEAQSVGKWILDPNAKTLTLFRADGATVVRVFAIDDVNRPLSRT